MRKQFVVGLKDLRFATLLCARCNTRVTLDLDTEFDVPTRIPFRTPTECPRCNTQFDSAVPRAIDAMQRVYKALTPVSKSVSFSGDDVELGEASGQRDPDRSDQR